LTLAADGQAEVVYPFDTRRGERVTVDVTLPKPSAVPEGFVYVAAGSFWYGDADEQLRTQFLDTSPIHRRQTGAYLVARHETTYRDWIVFLDAQTPAERERHLPEVSTAARGWIRLRRADAAWQLAFQPATIRYAARVGEPVTYVGRKVLARQDWSLFPVTGISFVDVKAYLAWLDATGRVPGARLCTELEWERAARGGDDRVFPHGDELHESDANFDVTYGRIDSAFGPDAVGSHPASRSPFGLDDLAGNVLELVASSEKADEIVIRGGGYYFGAASARSTNRLSVPATFRDFATGFRVCASLQGER
jgi:formylglycine-generating enzyme required for sulfatase activity